jgi:hypothetical protein
MIRTRAAKGAALTHAEADENFTDLRDGVNAMVPKTKGEGIRLGPNGAETFGWHDIIGAVFVHDPADPLAPDYATFVGGIKQYRFEVNDEAELLFHLPHDYTPGTDIYIHAHWSHDSALVTGGSVTWGFELTYAKGHNQAAFGPTITIVELQNASLVQRQHMVCEAPASISGGSASLLDTADIEADGLVFGRVYLATNAITVASGPVPSPFLHTVDIHYQSTAMPTKQRSPDFWT